MRKAKWTHGSLTFVPSVNGWVANVGDAEVWLYKWWPGWDPWAKPMWQCSLRCPGLPFLSPIPMPGTKPRATRKEAVNELLRQIDQVVTAFGLVAAARHKEGGHG